jgi:hypothetical protein
VRMKTAPFRIGCTTQVAHHTTVFHEVPGNHEVLHANTIALTSMQSATCNLGFNNPCGIRRICIGVRRMSFELHSAGSHSSVEVSSEFRHILRCH